MNLRRTMARVKARRLTEVAMLSTFLFCLTPAAARGEQDGLGDRGEVEAFADAMVAEHRERFDIPGLVLVIVYEGEVALAKGYGFSDLERRIPVDVERTVFPVASLSKTFTATAGMQLVDRGLASLDEDVNRYLEDFQVEARFDRPITLAHLLTHTSGLDTKYSDVMTASGEPIPPLGPYLADTLPPRVYPPGTVSRYSNFGITLAGHVVERVSGLPFSDYVRTEIFDVLGMSRSAFGSPGALASDLAVGYTLGDDGVARPVNEPRERTVLVPAAGLYTTGSDMARYLLAHLGWGPPLMSDEALEEMHRGRFYLHPRAPGVTLGFHEHFENGRGAILHDGDWKGFSGRLYLLPEEDFGLFLSFNTSSPLARASLLSEVLDRFFPAAASEDGSEPVTPDEAALDRYVGTYAWSRFPVAGTLKTLRLLAEARVEKRSSGSGPGLELELELGGPIWRSIGVTKIELVPEEPLVFRRVSGDGRVFFQESEGSDVSRLLISVPEIRTTGSMQFDRVASLASARAQAVISLVALPLVLSGLLWLPLYLTRLLRRQPLERAGRWSGWARVGGMAVSSLTLAFATLVGPAFQGIEIYGPHRLLAATLWIPPVIAALTAALVVFATLAWRRGFWSLAARIHYTLFTGSALTVVGLIGYWNLFGNAP